MLETLKSNVKHSNTYDGSDTVEAAFKIGLFYQFFPEDVLDHLEHFHWWTREEVEKSHLKIGFLSETATSWHAFYRLWREKGWERFQVKREGGLIQYWLKITNPLAPEDQQELRIRLDITLSTCKRVSKGFVTQQVEQFETVCEDLVDPEDEVPAPITSDSENPSP